MIRFKDIHIPNPCSVDYDYLPGNEVKRFCGSCKKHVYDFRGKDEIYFNSIVNTHGKVCGIFYDDDIQSRTVKIKRPFYFAIAAKLIAALLFLKTLLSSDHAEAADIPTHFTTQQSTDSTGVKVNIKNRPSSYQTYVLDIFINNTFYKSGANLDNGTGFIWLPDSLKENDKIRIMVKDYGDNRGSYKIHRKEYNFNYKESEKITVKIQFHKRSEIHLFKKRRRATAGYMYC